MKAKQARPKATMRFARSMNNQVTKIRAIATSISGWDKTCHICGRKLSFSASSARVAIAPSGPSKSSGIRAKR